MQREDRLERVVGVKTRALLRFLQRNNLLYLLSALLMLAGCYLVCTPYLFGRRGGMGGLLSLLVVINIYEGLVIATASYIGRRAPQNRECSILILVELLFLLDATLTISATMPTHFAGGLAVAGASLLLAFLKVFLLQVGTGRRVFEGIRETFLLPALVVLYTFQLPLALLQNRTLPEREFGAYSIWLALGALLMIPALLRFSPSETSGPAIGEKEDARPWWLSAGFKKTVVGVVALVLALQVIGQMWVYRAPFSMSYLVPVLLALFFLASGLRVLKHLDLMNVPAISAAALMLALDALLCVRQPLRVPLAGSEVLLTPLRMNLFIAALFLLVAWKRDRFAGQFNFALVLLAVGVAGYDAAGIAVFIGAPTTEGLLLLAPLVGLWVWFNGDYPRRLAAVSAVLLLLVKKAAGFVDTAPLWEFVRYWPLSALVLGLLTRIRARGWLWMLASLSLCLGLASAFHFDAAGLVHFLAVAIVFGIGVLSAGRVYLYGILVYLVTANLLLHELPLPTKSSHWGGIAVALAFVVFGLGFLVTRRALRAAGSTGVQAGRVNATGSGPC